jgi:hypothetical protein
VLTQFRCPCGVPFVHRHDGNVLLLERSVDEAFRKALMDGVPVSLRSKMRRALAAVPDPDRDLAHSRRYFGERLPAISGRVKPLVVELEKYLTRARNLPGLNDWLIVTGFDNHYEMVKVLDEWAQMKRDTH